MADHDRIILALSVSAEAVSDRQEMKQCGEVKRTLEAVAFRERERLLGWVPLHSIHALIVRPEIDG